MVDYAIRLALETLEKETTSDKFSLLVQEKIAGISIDQKELAEHLILNVLSLARQNELTENHQVVAIMPFNLNV